MKLFLFLNLFFIFNKILEFQTNSINAKSFNQKQENYE